MRFEHVLKIVLLQLLLILMAVPCSNGVMVCQTVVFNADSSFTNTSVTDGVGMVQRRTYAEDGSTRQLDSCDENNNCSTVSFLGEIFSLSSQLGDWIIITTYVK